MSQLKATLVVALLGWGVHPHADAADDFELGRIRLKRQAMVEERAIRLSDVAELRGHAATRLADVQVSSVDPGGSTAKVSLAGLRPTLDREGVNWGRLSLGGFSHCRVLYIEPEITPDATTSEPSEPSIDRPAFAVVYSEDLLLVNPTGAVSIDAVLTVRDHAMRFLEESTGWGPNELAVEFAARDHAILAQLTGHDRLEFEPGGVVDVGRLPITVRRYRDDQIVGTERLTADVARKRLAVVATRTLARGQSMTPADVEVREVLIINSTADPMTNLDDVIGQVAGRFMRQGHAIHRDDVRPPVMVRRGELMTIHCMTDGLLIKTVARASEDGLLGQSIRVRNDQSREQYVVHVTGPKRGAVRPNNPSVKDDAR